jgi:peptidoglycan/xylan/chitin deacetylase (PgdA/CDA1 family)
MIDPPFKILTGLVVIVTLALAGTPAAARGQVALTFDDLPALTVLRGESYVDYLTKTLLRKLKRQHIPATGFVNEGKLEQDAAPQIADLNRWLDSGMGLGNHTFSHESPTQIGAQAYIEDIIKGEPVIRRLLAEHGERLEWFRHPYLDTGSPAPVRHEIDAWLAAHHYRVAPVTIDADDWEFAEPYDDAIARHDLVRQRRIRQEYLAYTALRVTWSQASARVLFDRDIAHVMLLHGTRLNADTLDELAHLLRRAHLRPVSLEQALSDPAYRTRDDYSGKDGINWLERWAITLHKTLPAAGDIDPPQDIQREYDRVDNDRGK